MSLTWLKSHKQVPAITHWSDEVFANHGLAPGKPPPLDDGLAFYVPEHRNAMRAAVLACIREGTPFDIEAQLIAATGECSWVRAIGEAERDDTGAVRLIQGAFQDITERKEAHEQSRQLIERLINTLESITDAFFTLDRDWHFTYVNREAESVLQRSRKELLGKTFGPNFRPPWEVSSKPNTGTPSPPARPCSSSLSIPRCNAGSTFGPTRPTRASPSISRTSATGARRGSVEFR